MSEVKNNLKNLNPLNSGPMAAKKNQVTEEKFREVSDMYEKYFIKEMMKEMKNTVQESGFIKKNHAEKIFQDQLDDQYATQWGKAGGIGLSQLIFDQLMSRYGEQYGLKQRLEKPQGPLAVNEKSNYRGLVMPQLENKNETTIKISAADKSMEPQQVKSPWAGVLLDKKYLDMDQVAYRIKHDNGLESLIMTRGSSGTGGPTLSPRDTNSQLSAEAKHLSLGDRVGTGQDLGLHSAESPLLWTIKPSVE